MNQRPVVTPTSSETTCTECGQVFTVTIEYVPRFHDGKQTGELIRFVCPHCEYAWNSAFVTMRGLRARGKLAEARKRQQQRPSDSTLREIAALEREVAHETKPLAGTGRMK